MDRKSKAPQSNSEDEEDKEDEDLHRSSKSSIHQRKDRSTIIQTDSDYKRRRNKRDKSDENEGESRSKRTKKSKRSYIGHSRASEEDSNISEETITPKSKEKRKQKKQ